MELAVKSDGDLRYLVTCPAEMEWDARVDMVAALKAAVGTTAPTGVILDLGNVTYINSAGLGAIFALRKFVQQGGGKLVVSRPKPAMMRLLDTINLPALVPVTESLDEARQILNQNAGGTT